MTATRLFMLACFALGAAHALVGQTTLCSPHASLKGRGIRLTSADGETHQLESLRCYPGFLYARRKGKWAILDTDAHFRTPFRFDQIEAFDRGLAAVREDGRQGYINESGEALIPIRFQKIRPLGTHRFLARGDQGWFLYDRSGALVNSAPYTKVSAFYDGYAVTRAGKFFGVLAEDGHEIATPRYDEILKFFQGYAMVRRGDKWGHMDTSGREVIPAIYDEVFVFYEGLSLARLGDTWGYINQAGETVLPFVYDYVEHFNQGRALVAREGKWGFIARDGQPIIPLVWDRIHPFHEGMAKVEQNSKQGYIGWLGDTIIPPVYDEIYRFLDGIAITRQGDLFGFIRDDGSVLSAPEWQAVWPFRDGLAVVERDGRFGVINRDNEVMVQPRYDAVQAHGGGSISVRQDGAWMYVDALPNADAVVLDPGQAARVKLGDEWGYIDQSGHAFGFAKGPVEFVDTHADLGRVEGSEAVSYTFRYRNSSELPLNVEDIHLPCDCDYWLLPEGPVAPGRFGDIHVRCALDATRSEWQRTIPVKFAGMEEPIPLQLRARHTVTDSVLALMENVPINGRYVFLLDISASMDELPLAKMVFAKLAASLCRDDNISIVSFNSFSKVELRPTENHAEVVHTIRRLRPALKTDAARGLRLSYAILREGKRALEKHIYMASDGDLDPEALERILAQRGDPDVLLTVFVFSYTGDETAFRRLSAENTTEQVRYVYVDRENISEVLDLGYTDIGCLPPEQMPSDSLRLHRVDDAPFGALSRVREQRRYGLVDRWDNLLIPPLYEEMDFPGQGLIRTQLGGQWHLFDRCEPITSRAYDSIGLFEHGRALARRDSVTVLLDNRGREYDYLPELRENLLYRDSALLADQPFANLTLLLDLSASMDRPDKLPLLKETFTQFSGILRYEDKVGIVSYTNSATVELPPTQAWQRKRLLETVEGLRSRGATRVYDGLALAYKQAVQGWINDGNNRVILATDGRFESSLELEALLDRYRARGLELTMYLFGEEARSTHVDALQAMADRAGGRFVHVRADNVAQTLLEEVRIRERPAP